MKIQRFKIFIKQFKCYKPHKNTKITHCCRTVKIILSEQFQNCIKTSLLKSHLLKPYSLDFTLLMFSESIDTADSTEIKILFLSETEFKLLT